MKHLRPLRFALLSLVALTVVLTACGAPNDNTPAVQYSPSDTTSAINDFQVVAEGLIKGSLSSGAQQAADSWPQRMPESTEAGKLPRGEYEWSEAGDDWNLVSSSTQLILRWSFLDEDASAHQAVLTIDWAAGSPTVTVNVGDTTQEAPQDATATLQVDGAELGGATARATWQEVPTCGLILEPSSLRVTAFVGDSDGKLALDELTVSLPYDTGTLATTGKVSGTSGADSLSFDWNLSAQGSVTRDPTTCGIVDSEITSGRVSLGVSANDESLGIAFNAGDFVFDGSDGTVQSVTITHGALRINGSVAVSFAGTLSATADTVPGSNLQLTFSDGSTMTLAEYIESNFMGLATLAKLGRALNR